LRSRTAVSSAWPMGLADFHLQRGVRVRAMLKVEFYPVAFLAASLRVGFIHHFEVQTKTSKSQTSQIPILVGA
jgi:hypothetical protein